MSETIEQLKQEQAEYYSIIATGIDRIQIATEDYDLKKVRRICKEIEIRPRPYRRKIEKMAAAIREDSEIDLLCANMTCEGFDGDFTTGCSLTKGEMSQCVNLVRPEDGLKQDSCAGMQL